MLQQILTGLGAFIVFIALIALIINGHYEREYRHRQRRRDK